MLLVLLWRGRCTCCGELHVKCYAASCWRELVRIAVAEAVVAGVIVVVAGTQHRARRRDAREMAAEMTSLHRMCSARSSVCAYMTVRAADILAQTVSGAIVTSQQTVLSHNV